MSWFRATKSVAPNEPELTAEDYLLQADRDLHEAEVEYAQAHLLVNGFYDRHRDYLPLTDVAGKVVLRIKPPNADLAGLLSRENRSIENRNRCMARRAELRRLYQPEVHFVGGVKVSV
jgi:hypothetical protein